MRVIVIVSLAAIVIGASFDAVSSQQDEVGQLDATPDYSMLEAAGEGSLQSGDQDFETPLEAPASNPADIPSPNPENPPPTQPEEPPQVSPPEQAASPPAPEPSQPSETPVDVNQQPATPADVSQQPSETPVDVNQQPAEPATEAPGSELPATGGAEGVDPAGSAPGGDQTPPVQVEEVITPAPSPPEIQPVEPQQPAEIPTPAPTVEIPTSAPPAVDVPTTQSSPSSSTTASPKQQNKASVQPIVFGMTEACLNCMCQQISGCRLVPNCVNGTCGKYHISYKYWQKGGNRTIETSKNLRKGSVEAFIKCAENDNCARDTVRSYMRINPHDCDKNGAVTCVDYAQIHHFGANRCLTRSDKNIQSFIKTCMSQEFMKQFLAERAKYSKVFIQ